MWQHLVRAVAWCTLAGCSLIYNPNNLPPPSDAEVIRDADPSMLVIDDVTPSVIYEGQGDLGSPPALVVIHGHHIIDNQTVVEITPTAGAAQLTLGAPVISKNGDWIAIPVTAHVDPGLKKGVTVPLDIRVQETAPPQLGGQTSMSLLSGKLAVVGLKELVPGSADVPELTGSVIDTLKLEERYSKVDLSAVPAVTFVGARRAIIASMSSIDAKSLAANGAAGANTGAAKGVVGGCSGGAPGARGDCPSGGGAGNGQLAGGGGGGGAGFASLGDAGAGAGAGAGGAKTGDELIVTYEGNGGQPANQAGGGGGGGTPTLGEAGGGGAGGGSIELTAEGDIRVEAISALGGPGYGAATASGGGGAGGLVMVRAGGTLAVAGTIDVTGGKGGQKGQVGGNGSGGRVRWDAPAGGAPTAAGGTLHRGPAFTVPERVFRTSRATITMIGQRDDLFDVYSVHGGVTKTEKTRVSFGPDDKASFDVVLEKGHTRLCITLLGGKQGTREADKCIDVAFLP